MKAVTKLMTGAAGVAALVVAAAPASAQVYNPYGGGNVVGQILQSVLNPYGAQQGYAYQQNPQVLVNQCTAAVQGQLAQRYSAGYNQYGAGYGGYNQYNGYNGYNNAYSNARVVGIRSVERRSSTTTRVRGYASSGMAMNYGGYGNYAGYGGYAQPQAQADLTFKCDIDYRGYIRDIDINRR